MTGLTATYSRWRARAIWRLVQLQDVLYDWRGVFILVSIWVALGWASWKYNPWWLVGYPVTIAMVLFIWIDMLVYISNGGYSAIPQSWGDVDYRLRMQFGNDWRERFFDQLRLFRELVIVFAMLFLGVFYLEYAFLPSLSVWWSVAIGGSLGLGADIVVYQYHQSGRQRLQESNAAYKVERPTTEEQMEEAAS
jgi:hypothetical protein